MNMMIDIDKFVASIMKCLCMPHREDAYMCRHWITKALDAQGLKFENGEIVKSQRTIAAEAKEAIFDDEDERIRKALVDVLNSDFEKDTEIHGITVGTIIAWLEKQGEKKISNWDEKDSSMQFTLMRDIDQVSFISPEGKAERIKWLNSLDDRFVTKGKESV